MKQGMGYILVGVGLIGLLGLSIVAFGLPEGHGTGRAWIQLLLLGAGSLTYGLYLLFGRRLLR